ncbi:hypothetical protein [Spirochaeta cellobiosiphila]|uniref:hypothetical protein n=1 Tax=Spirochaeta cellobiosiphila TaxID=504483 RepID=UPI001B7FE085|nr:hypothetical protein [Spirochaeta cellobiosiphila]
MEEAKNIDLLKSIWPYISPENSSFQSDFLINKVLIAILSYIPVTLLRMIYTAHAQRKLKLQINDLRTDLEDLKKEIHSKK